MLTKMASEIVTSLTHSANIRTSKCSIVLGILFTIFFVLFIAVVVVWAALSDGFHNLGGFPDLCSTKACIAAASRLTSSMTNKDASACDDLYELSCGRYHQKSQQLSYSEELMFTTLDQLHAQINTRSRVNESTRTLLMVRQLYASCMDVRSRTVLGTKPFLAAMKNFPCGPIFNECSSFNADFYSFERHAGMLDWLAGSANLITSDRDVHPDNREMLILSLKVPNFSELLADTKITMRSFAQPGLSEYEPLMIVTIKQQLLNPLYSQIFGDDVLDKEVLLDEVAELIIELDKTLSVPSISSASVTTISQLMTDVPQINWQYFFNAKFSNLHWNASDSVLVESLEAFRHLAAVVARTPRRALANYLTFMMALNLHGYLYNAAVRTHPLHWRECVQQLTGLDATANVYIEARRDSSFTEIHSVLNFMKDTFVEEHNKFPPTLQTQLRNLVLKVGYPQRLLYEDAIIQAYNNYEVISNDYFTSIVTALSMQRIYENAHIGSRLDVDDSVRYNILSASITYNLNENSIVVPISFLQHPISLPIDTPLYSVYGTLGVVFMQILAKIIWDSSLSTSLLNDALQCIEHPFLSIQSTSTLAAAPQQRNDMIYALHLSDAVNSALNSYSLWQNQNRIGEEARLPSLQNYDTIKQLFFSFSTLYCNSVGQQANSTYRAIINAVGFNSNAFTNAFKCSPTSRLYNRRTCT